MVSTHHRRSLDVQLRHDNSYGASFYQNRDAPEWRRIVRLGSVAEYNQDPKAPRNDEHHRSVRGSLKSLQQLSKMDVKPGSREVA